MTFLRFCGFNDIVAGSLHWAACCHRCQHARLLRSEIQQFSSRIHSGSRVHKTSLESRILAVCTLRCLYQFLIMIRENRSGTCPDLVNAWNRDTALTMHPGTTTSPMRRARRGHPCQPSGCIVSDDSHVQIERLHPTSLGCWLEPSNLWSPRLRESQAAFSWNLKFRVSSFYIIWSFVMICFNFKYHLCRNGIKPVYVFDGKPPEMKLLERNHAHWWVIFQWHFLSETSSDSKPRP